MITFILVLLQSLNGVFVNGHQIPPSSCAEIKPGDRICFGVAIENNVHEFDYTFEVASRKRKSECWDAGQQNESKVRKVLRESSKDNKNEPGTSKDCEENVYLAIEESEKKIEALNLMLAEKEKAYQMQIEEKEKDLAEQLLQQKEVLEQEKQEQEKYLMELLDDKVRGKEKDLNDQLEQQKAILLAEKVKVENDLLQELDRKLEEKDKELTERLQTQRDRLENVLQLKVNEQIQLQEELNRNKIEREKLLGLEENEKRLEQSLEMLKGQLAEKQDLLTKQQEVTRKAEEMAERVLVEQMEDEFTCIICHELFVQATTLVCSHSFCDFCLKSWLKRKKLCPICRTDFKGMSVRSIVLDSAVEKIVETMDEEAKERRRGLSQERKRLSQGKQRGSYDQL